MKRNKDIYTLSTGREIYANCGIVGINDELEVFDGYDGDFDGSFRKYRDALTPEEQREVCDYMISLWQLRRETIVKGSAEPE